MHQRRIAGHSALSFSGKVLVAFGDRDLHRERHQQHTPAHGFVDAVEPRLVVTADEQLELRGEVEEVLPHEPGGDLVAAGECFDLGFVPAPAFLSFLCNDQAGAVELGEIGRVAFGIAGEERRHIGDGGVVAEDGGDGIDERAFAVGAGAVGEDEDVFGGEAGAAVADIAF